MAGNVVSHCAVWLKRVVVFVLTSIHDCNEVVTVCILVETSQSWLCNVLFVLTYPPGMTMGPYICHIGTHGVFELDVCLMLYARTFPQTPFLFKTIADLVMSEEIGNAPAPTCLRVSIKRYTSSNPISPLREMVYMNMVRVWQYGLGKVHIDSQYERVT